MKVKFYGVRGSVPTPGPEFAYYGGNTLCILLTFSDNTTCILDAGTGIRVLGNEMSKWPLKQKENLPLYDARREEELVESIVKYNKGPLYRDNIIQIFENILRNVQILEKDENL